MTKAYLSGSIILVSERSGAIVALLYNIVKGKFMNDLLTRLIANAEVAKNIQAEADRAKALYELGIIKMSEQRAVYE